MAAFLRKIIGAILLGLAVLLAVENAEELKQTIRLSCDFFIEGWKFHSPPLPIFFVIILAFIVGLLYSWLTGLISVVAAKIENLLLKQKVEKLQKKLDEAEARMESGVKNEPESPKGGGDG
ncbi:LapA family protein [bacterium]|nr:MAG: LapA family protein [bacterium]